MVYVQFEPNAFDPEILNLSLTHFWFINLQAGWRNTCLCVSIKISIIDWDKTGLKAADSLKMNSDYSSMEDVKLENS